MEELFDDEPGPPAPAGQAQTGALDALGLTLEELQCPICVETIQDPFVTSCGHTFCYICLSRHLANKNTCPSCCGYLTIDKIFPNFLLSKVRAAALAHLQHPAWALASPAGARSAPQRARCTRAAGAQDRRGGVAGRVVLVRARRQAPAGQAGRGPQDSRPGGHHWAAGRQAARGAASGGCQQLAAAAALPAAGQVGRQPGAAASRLPGDLCAAGRPASLQMLGWLGGRWRSTRDLQGGNDAAEACAAPPPTSLGDGQRRPPAPPGGAQASSAAAAAAAGACGRRLLCCRAAGRTRRSRWGSCSTSCSACSRTCRWWRTARGRPRPRGRGRSWGRRRRSQRCCRQHSAAAAPLQRWAWTAASRAWQAPPWQGSRRSSSSRTTAARPPRPGTSWRSWLPGRGPSLRQEGCRSRLLPSTRRPTVLLPRPLCRPRQQQQEQQGQRAHLAAPLLRPRWAHTAAQHSLPRPWPRKEISSSSSRRRPPRPAAREPQLQQLQSSSSSGNSPCPGLHQQGACRRRPSSNASSTSSGCSCSQRQGRAKPVRCWRAAAARGGRGGPRLRQHLPTQQRQRRRRQSRRQQRPGPTSATASCPSSRSCSSATSACGSLPPPAPALAPQTLRSLAGAQRRAAPGAAQRPGSGTSRTCCPWPPASRASYPWHRWAAPGGRRLEGSAGAGPGAAAAGADPGPPCRRSSSGSSSRASLPSAAQARRELPRRWAAA
jgi:hypothetical protein